MKLSRIKLSGILAAALVAFLFCAGLGTARAQIVEVPNTPRATVNGATVGVWAYVNALGTCFDDFKLTPSGWQGGFITPSQCYLEDDFQARINQAGGATAWIKANLPAINAGLQRATPSTTGPPPATGSPAGDAINQALASSFKLVVGADGTVALAPK